MIFFSSSLYLQEKCAGDYKIYDKNTMRRPNPHTEPAKPPLTSFHCR